MTDDHSLERALDRLSADGSPHAHGADLAPEEQQMLRMAQLLRGSAGQEVAPEFAERLQGRLHGGGPSVSRRTAVVSGLGALAAAIGAGFGLGRLNLGGAPRGSTALVSPNGRWYAVARVADLAEGSINPFTAGAVQGFLIQQGGELRAVSRICTHMGCTLTARPRERRLICPCHGAEFDLHGQLRSGPGGYRYAISVPPLPAIRTRVRGQTVEVWGV